MDNPRPEKVAVVAEVREKLDGVEAVVLTEYRGLDVRAMAELRTALREAGGEYKIYKNTMVRFAAAELDLEIEEFLVGPTAMAFTGTRPDGSAGDAVTIAKALTEFGKTNENLVIKGGLLDGELLDVEQIMALSKIAPREELLSRLAGGMAAPMQQFAALLNAVNAKFAYALQALIDAGGAPGAPESAPADAEPADASADAEAEPADVATGDDGEGDAENAEAATDDAAAEESAADEGGESEASAEGESEEADSDESAPEAETSGEDNADDETEES